MKSLSSKKLVLINQHDNVENKIDWKQSCEKDVAKQKGRELLLPPLCILVWKQKKTRSRTTTDAV